MKETLFTDGGNYNEERIKIFYFDIRQRSYFHSVFFRKRFRFFGIEMIQSLHYTTPAPNRRDAFFKTVLFYCFSMIFRFSNLMANRASLTKKLLSSLLSLQNGKESPYKQNFGSCLRGEPEAICLNFYMGQRPADILSLTMEQLKTKEGMAYFEIMPHKTEGRGVISYAPVPKELYEEIKNRTGKLLRQRKGKEYTQKTFEKHFQKIRKMDERLTGLSFQATRNSASTAYYESGSSVGQNMTILGHTQEQTNLSIYRQNTPKQAIEALKRRLKEEEKNK